MNSSFSEHEVADARLYQFDSEIDHDELATKKKKKTPVCKHFQTYPIVVAGNLTGGFLLLERRKEYPNRNKIY